MSISLHETIYIPVKILYHKIINFLSNELEEPIIKQYLDNYPSKALYTSHETCDSFVSCTDKCLWEQTKERLKLSTDIALFADEASNAARKERNINKEFNMDFFL